VYTAPGNTFLIGREGRNLKVAFVTTPAVAASLNVKHFFCTLSCLTDQNKKKTHVGARKNKKKIVPYVLNITATPPARNQSALAVKLGN
jgi:hypothetical protein